MDSKDRIILTGRNAKLLHKYYKLMNKAAKTDKEKYRLKAEKKLKKISSRLKVSTDFMLVPNWTTDSVILQRKENSYEASKEAHQEGKTEIS